MIKKYLVLIVALAAVILFIIATKLYPGGSMFNSYSVGFDWRTNFISDLFKSTAANGAANPARYWACLAMILLPVSYAIFFSRMAVRIPEKNAAYILKYGGILNVISMFLIVTPLHDLMLNISIALFWTCIVVITVFVFKTRLHVFKFFCLFCLLVFYGSLYLWATNDWKLLPLMQKTNFINSTLLILGLEYFTKREDFAHIKPRKTKKQQEAVPEPIVVNNTLQAIPEQQ